MTLLAVDLGLRCGVAVYGPDGRLQRYASRHYAKLDPLRRDAHRTVSELPALRFLVLEGDAQLASIWQRLAERRAIESCVVPAERWREALLLPRQRRSGPAAKGHADTLARAVIAWSGAKRPTSLRHDAAEAICIGLWGALHFGLLAALPPPLRRGS